MVLGGVEWEEGAGGDEGEASLERQARVARSTAQMAAMMPQRHALWSEWPFINIIITGPDESKLES